MRRSWAIILALIPALAGISLADPPDLTKPTLYEVGYAHLDTQWRWTYPQVIREFLRNTMEDNFPLIEKYPHYVFNFTGARRYELMKEYFPADFERLRQYVKQGRWYPDGSSVDECDNDVPSAESLVRQVLYGNQFYRREFGIEGHDFMLPDSFGFTAALPEILAHCGIKGFSTQKLSWGSAVGIPFKVGVWIGPDGRRILAALDPGPYNAEVRGDASRSVSELLRINQTGKLSGDYVDFRYYGTGDVGGGPKEPSVAAIEKSVTSDGPIHVVSARSDQLFDDITPAQEATLPTYKGEFLLTWHSCGSITSQSAMKRWNRKNELLADAAERASVAASWLGTAEYPSQRLHDAWFLVLGSQMHDMMAGTARPEAYNFTWNDEQLALNQFRNVATDAVGAIASGLDTQVQGVPLVVYNPLSTDRQDVVEANVDFGNAQSLPKDISVVAPDGSTVPSQIIGAVGSSLRILFLANAPSVGFSVYDVRPLDSPRVNTVLSPGYCGSFAPNTIENAHYKITVNSSGDIASIFDKRNKREALAQPARLAFLRQKPSLYPAWNMDWEDQRVPPYAYVDGPASIRVTEQGDVRTTLEVTRQSQGSKFIQRISLASGSAGDRIDVRNVIDWQTQGCSLKATFPLSVSNPLASYDSQVGVIVRGNNNEKKYEVPQHQWFDLTSPDNSYGVAVLNDCKYGSDKPDDRTMRLTLLYTPGVRDNYQDQATQDIGRHEMLYSVYPHAGDWRQADVPTQAARINQPLMVFQTDSHVGRGRSLSLFEVSSPQVAVTAIKKAEESDEIIIRLRELDGAPADGVQITGPVPIVEAREVTGQEQPLGPAVISNGSLVANLRPFDLRAFAIRLPEPPKPPDAVVQQPVALPFDLTAATTAENLSSGSFDDDGRTYPAEEFPSALTVDGIHFQLGTGKNAVACHGQTIPLPDGPFDKVYLLASSIDGDQEAQFNSTQLNVQDWTLNVGAWDRRTWKGAIDVRAFRWTAAWDGLVPGFVKPAEVAWFSNHKHNPKEGNEYYQYCYLFKYVVPISSGSGRTLTLPDNPHVRLFAATVAGRTHDAVTAAFPLTDTMEGRTADSAPAISPPGASGSDTVSVAINHPLYWIGGQLRYTTDGSAVTASSPVYSGPIDVSMPTTINAAEIGEDGAVGQTATAVFNVHDVTPPRIVQATAVQEVPAVTIVFSKSATADSAQSVQNYQFNPPLNVTAAHLQDDGRTVVLTLDDAVDPSVHRTLTAWRIRSSSGIEIKPADVALTNLSPVYVQNQPASQSVESTVAGLPGNAGDSWTINLFCRPNANIADRTLIAGFGRADAVAGGQGRYLAKFKEGLHFWSNNADVEGKARLDVGQWQMLTVTYDGQTIRLYKNGHAAGHGDVRLQDDESAVRIAPIDPWDFQRMFNGEIRRMTVWNQALDEPAIQAIYARHADAP